MTPKQVQDVNQAKLKGSGSGTKNIEINAGNTAVLTVQLLASIQRELKEIKTIFLRLEEKDNG
jgi:hypothetical protein